MRFTLNIQALNIFLDKEESFMQVVVLRSPKALRGILRLLFRIKKDEGD